MRPKIKEKRKKHTIGRNKVIILCSEITYVKPHYYVQIENSFQWRKNYCSSVHRHCMPFICFIPFAFDTNLYI